jgi:ketosteroid isomerase-like protein
MEQNKNPSGTNTVDSAAKKARQAATHIPGHVPITVTPSAVAETEIRQLIEEYADSIRSGKIDDIMSFYDQGLVAYDAAPPLRMTSIEDYKKNWEQLFTTAMEFPVTYEFSEERVIANQDIGVFHALVHTQGTFKNPPPGEGKNMECWGRLTCCLKKTSHRWRIIHEHFSMPVGDDGKAIMNLKPGFQASH